MIPERLNWSSFEARNPKCWWIRFLSCPTCTKQMLTISSLDDQDEKLLYWNLFIQTVLASSLKRRLILAYFIFCTQLYQQVTKMNWWREPWYGAMFWLQISFSTRCNYSNNYFFICGTDVEEVAFSKRTASHHASSMSVIILINWCLEKENRKIKQLNAV